MNSTGCPRSTSAWPTAHIAWLLPTPGRPKASTLVASARKSPSASSCSRRTSAGGSRPSSSVANVFPGGSLAPRRNRVMRRSCRSWALKLEDFQQQRERRLLLRLDEPRDHLARGCGERKPREEGCDLIADGAERDGGAHAAGTARSAS